MTALLLTLTGSAHAPPEPVRVERLELFRLALSAERVVTGEIRHGPR